MPYANVNLEGRLVNDPEIKVGKNDRKFVTFRLAVNQQFGEQENASFYNCTGSEAMASRMEKAGLCKGKLIHLCGNLTIREYTDRENNQRTSVDVGILDWQYAGSKPRDGETGATPSAPPKQAGAINAEQYIGDEDDLPI